MDDPDFDHFQKKQMKMAFRESVRSVIMDENRCRFSVSGPPVSIRGRGSQYETGGSSSQPKMRQCDSIKDVIDIERERARWQFQRSSSAWYDMSPSAFRKEGSK